MSKRFVCCSGICEFLRFSTILQGGNELPTCTKQKEKTQLLVKKQKSQSH